MGSQDAHRAGGSGGDQALDGVIDAVMLTISKRFDLVFARSDVRELMEGFVAGEIAFIIVNDEIQIARRESLEVPDTIPPEWS